MSAREAAEGFVRIAVDNMANAIKQISIARGHDVTRYTLQCFGGAGGQHACLVADALGIERVMIHPLAGVLSAYGMGLADMVELRQRTLAGAELEAVLGELEAEAVAALAAQGVETPGNPAPGGAALRGQRFQPRSARSRIRCGRISRRRTRRASASSRRRRRWWSRRRSSRRSGTRTERVPAEAGSPGPAARACEPRLFAGEDLYDRADLSPGDIISGPALIIDPSATTVVEPGWRAEVDALGNLILTRAHPRAAAAAGAEADPVMLEVMANLFMAIAEEMGVALQNTASSVNIKERLDFSCALFDREGSLIANAPHIPVHLGSMGDSIRTLIEARGREAGRARHERRRRLRAQRALSRRHPSARHHRHHAGVRGRTMRSPPGTSRRAAIMPISAASRRDRCRRTAARCTRRGC